MDGWAPDEALVEKVRMVGCSIRDLSTEDRTWTVVSLSAMGWTAQDIADRMGCSLRLIRNIKADPVAAVMEYAFRLTEQLIAERGLFRLEITGMEQALARALAELDILRIQRGDLITQLQLERLQNTPAARRQTPRKKIS